jgi:hypothetical protein
MQPHNRKKLDDRVIRAAEAALAAQKYVSPVDVLVGIGWLDPGALKPPGASSKFAAGLTACRWRSSSQHLASRCLGLKA